MLVLSRRNKETIRIGDNILITVIGQRGGAVRIGIDAPKDVHVVRGELPPLAAADPATGAGPPDDVDTRKGLD